MKTLLTTLLIIAGISAFSQDYVLHIDLFPDRNNKVEIGYLVCTTGSREIMCKKVQKIETVQEIFEFHYPSYCVDVKNELKYRRLREKEHQE